MMTTNPTRRDTVRANSATTDQLLIEACKDVEGLKHGIDLLASTLAQWMEKLHGGSWRVQTEHAPDANFILIVPRLQKEPIKSGHLRRAV